MRSGKMATCTRGARESRVGPVCSRLLPFPKGERLHSVIDRRVDIGENKPGEGWGERGGLQLMNLILSP